VETGYHPPRPSDGAPLRLTLPSSGGPHPLTSPLRFRHRQCTDPGLPVGGRAAPTTWVRPPPLSTPSTVCWRGRIAGSGVRRSAAPSTPCCPMPSEAGGQQSPARAAPPGASPVAAHAVGEPSHRSACWSVALVCRCGPTCWRRATGRCAFFGRCRCRLRGRGGAGGGRWVGRAHRASGWGRLRGCGAGGGLGAGSGGLGRVGCVRALCWVGGWGWLLGCGVGEKPGARGVGCARDRCGHGHGRGGGKGHPGGGDREGGGYCSAAVGRASGQRRRATSSAPRSSAPTGSALRRRSLPAEDTDDPSRGAGAGAGAGATGPSGVPVVEVHPGPWSPLWWAVCPLATRW